MAAQPARKLPEQAAEISGIASELLKEEVMLSDLTRKEKMEKKK